MANVHDVAAYILNRLGPMTAMKLQKLTYYAQAWHLVFDGQPLFDSRIEAWANGPVVKDLYRMHRGRYSLNADDMPSVAGALERSEIETIDAVLRAYGHLDATQLSIMTHSEDPWIAAREGLRDGERGGVEISTASMQEFFERQHQRQLSEHP